jgi:hypothetical protein
VLVLSIVGFAGGTAAVADILEEVLATIALGAFDSKLEPYIVGIRDNVGVHE